MSTDQPKSEMSFEVAIEKLQATVKKLESGELTLEQSLQQFEEGVKLTRACQAELSTAEKRVEILMKAEGKPEFQPFGK
jgi:exodeoxyribonuclease VII small subunit